MTKKFQGLPSRVEYAAIPNYYLNVIMPSVDNLEELKISLHIFKMISKKRGSLRYTSWDELLADVAIAESLKTSSGTPEENLDRAISKAVERGLILIVELDKDGNQSTLYMLNTPANREAIESKNFAIPGKQLSKPPATSSEEMPNIFTCYEENIGLLTPLIADELRLAEQDYPVEWIIQAIGEAVKNNKRNWRYISRILERWLTEGKISGTYQQNNSADDPSKYTTGEYQRFVQH